MSNTCFIIFKGGMPVLKRTLIVCLIGLISFSLIPLSIVMDKEKQQKGLMVRDGVMDLSAWNYEQNKRIKLDGEWEFYWNRLLTSDDFNQAGTHKPSTTDFIKVPSQWNGKIVNGQPLPAFGFATYRMVLKNVPFNGTFALKKSNIRFSSAVYANGHMLFADGKPSQEAAGYRPGNIPQIGFFSSDKGDVEIIVQVANYDYVNGGIPVSIYFGEQAAMNELQQKSAAHQFSTFAILLTLAFIFFICFVTAALYRKKDYTLLVFAVICLLYAIYNGLLGERPLIVYLPGISFEVLFKMKDICSFACMIMLAIFFYQLQKSIISLKFTQAVTIVLSCYLVMIAFLPIRAYMVIQPYMIALYELMIIWLLLRIALLHIKSAETDRFKSFLLFMAILAINLYSIDIILFAFSFKENLWLGQFYIVVFNIILIFMIALRFFEAYHTIDEMKNQLLQLDKIKDDFLSNTSHELKTPLNAIVSITDTLIKGVEGPVNEKQAHNLTIVMESGRRLSYLVNELLDYSKMKHGDISLYKSGIDLKAVVDSVIGIHLFLLGGKQITLANRISENIPEVYADGNRLIQIMHNLIGNAIKFTEQGVVDVSAKVIRDRVEVRVKDTGIGITEPMQDRIFKAFEQADASETKNYGGTGLGLSITKKLVELHDGEIHVESNPGQGSVFIFTLPISGTVSRKMKGQADEKEPLQKDVSIAYSEYPLYVEGEKDESILVVDDEFGNLQSMINLLKLEGYSTLAVNRGQMALDELSKKREFFLVILDIMMPDMSGYGVLKAIRERFSSSELPVLMLTAKDRVDDMILSLENGANDFVGKPFEAEELMARLRSLIRLKASVKNAKDAEIAFLRSQIKPHFLYNALNSIAALCPDEPLKAEELTLQLSQYLRGSFDFKQLDSLTTIENELNLVQAYINIEKARFGDRLNVEYDVDVNRNILIPPLILQPLVENAIRHGLMSILRGGNVQISVKKEADTVISFAVEDNGCGMTEKKRQEILESDDQKEGVGLWNISRRLKLLYGKSLRIESTEGMGTKVSFEIPAKPIKQIGG
ncbi:ATP-binding protein [Paenibacillus sp. GCM10023248]|uniref:ATP-binding protein n=1 Tax=unclassified Paenibacillus TaxID=185978 RepID=UPI002379C04F|nr:ATP-binding protein [Paenibacillus sp. MAHUQ-63]MDD9269543.1 ATP-binding protein [Paenibacillus sp. MAHUQ-63]